MLEMGDEMATAPGRAGVRSPGNASRQWVLVEDKWPIHTSKLPLALPLVTGPRMKWNNGLRLPIMPDCLVNPGICLPALP